MTNKLNTITPADIASLINATIGITALTLTTTKPTLAARLILLAAIFDGLDGLLATHYGSSPIGSLLDSLSDTVSFVILPAVFLATLTPLSFGTPNNTFSLLALGTAILYSASGLLRLAFYTATNTDTPYTTGVPTTLAATIIAATYITGTSSPEIILGITLILVYLMLTNTQYPDLLVRDALIMGALQTLAIIFPTALNSLFSFTLLFCAIAYLFFSPFAYWRDTSLSATPTEPR